jgi:signal transduction histidine kinase
MLLLIGALIFAVSLTARRDISRPLQKLLVGIDDVAKGDLSHVVLSEREDEIGQLASRFNDMTGSLRDARAETQRGVEAKLALEAHLRRTEKLATIGQVAAEIAHEVGTPLNVVTGRARAMARKAEDPDAVQKNATIIAEQAARITRIIQRLLDFARRRVGDAEKLQTVDINRLAGDTLEFLEHQLANARIDAKPRLDRSIDAVPGDKDQLQQVLLNLFMNAIQAMPEGGQLDIVSSRIVRRRPGLEVAPEQEYAVLEVRDTGVGIPAESRDKIFEPFYTSKAGEGGTGLGLAVAHGIVKDHDGWIEIDDNLAAGRGTVFRLFFPMKPMSAAAA